MSFLNEDHWYPDGYDDAASVIRGAVADVSKSVHATMRKLGLAGSLDPATQDEPTMRPRAVNLRRPGDRP